MVKWLPSQGHQRTTRSHVCLNNPVVIVPIAHQTTVHQMDKCVAYRNQPPYWTRPASKSDGSVGQRQPPAYLPSKPPHGHAPNVAERWPLTVAHRSYPRPLKAVTLTATSTALCSILNHLNGIIGSTYNRQLCHMTLAEKDMKCLRKESWFGNGIQYGWFSSNRLN